ncbi:UDP-N-acetylmuramoylalanine--D-glutamate ligase [Polaribacter sp. Hel1_33_78]|jgi:UDP-N-acetylmuramoylalanine--D-glutamate ligase|uniref:UDP-N-acetylmuramoyl-L-alanine--D-glutamate ligase n=1 Tax=Polaribacter sp. Hel1_33_78 TaxID=1336804 RepID=UPI00087C9855|nr:UDP-N-acetylmuramoyl-L-alanine--D-glutamate ligase [Polaribacter sp. Hel1_33_78]MBT4414050.1 UDP-N-acetylmuramoyl-L-alanine--D-glutamate ligase [Polaribacter sp.]MBT7815902.1 UDP-N-acetylmuramoyl-L-alanine--D-glutamate ligase [Polaribacter sp.]SDT92114.1 UDP-N-acetylmuramoylalanine--D-glutamate ligase [Polaribacter sp. Hel1_33_78]
MKRLVILGGGESGVGTAILGKRKGYEVFVSDNNKILNKYKKVLLNNEIDFEENQHTESKILNADAVVKSPGIPEKVLIVQKLMENSIKVISEIEFAAQYTNATIIGITGSNGKTTTTLLTHHILKKAGLSVGIAGNIGDSFAQQVAEETYENYVLELSSFQLDGIENFKSHIAILTNITPDHLDRYEYDFDKYIASKFRITKNQKETDYLIYDADDPVINNWLKENKTSAKLVPFSLEKELEYGAYIKDNNIIININKDLINMPLSTLSIKGKHNTKNAMAASMAAQLLKARKQVIKESLEDFEGVEHRLENVAKVKDVEYINDSKATNVNATFYALECMDKTTVWIVGGVDKGNDYNDLLPLVREKVKAIVCLGLDNEKIKNTFGNVVDIIVETAGAEEAVKVSHKLAERGEVVLLSPACASFDLFDNYEDRGRQFKRAVKSL